jgi:Aspartyl protease
VSARAAWRAWARGDVDEAAGLAERAAEPRLLFLTSFVSGHYERALDYYAAVATRGGTLDEPVVYAWLHLGRPEEAGAHLRRRGHRVPEDLQSRIDSPLRSKLAAVTELSFAEDRLAPYLPAVHAELDGQGQLVHIDTGGPFLAMGTERAAALGIRLAPGGRGTHGTARTRLFTGTARELRLGDATLTNVPVAGVPTLREAQDVVVIGTNVLQQFLTTVDNPGRKLVLSPRRDPAHTAAHRALVAHRPEVAHVPFHLWGDHYMFIRGGLGTRRDMNLFVDSGLVYVVDTGLPRQACLYATARNYRRCGVPRTLAAGPHFDADGPVRLGPLEQNRHLLATTPARRVPWGSFGGVRIDAMLTNAFLRAYSWTIDFDRHEYTFRA